MQFALLDLLYLMVIKLWSNSYIELVEVPKLKTAKKKTHTVSHIQTTIMDLSAQVNYCLSKLPQNV